MCGQKSPSGVQAKPQQEVEIFLFKYHHIFDISDNNNNNNPICKAPECQKTSVALIIK